MNIFLICYVFFFGNTKSIKSNYKLESASNNINETMYQKSNKIYISKNYILDLINNYYDDYNDSKFTDNSVFTDDNEFTDDSEFTDNSVFTDDNEFTDDSEFTDDNINKANNIVDKNTKSPIMQGINYAYSYEDHDKNKKILNDINKNLYLQKQKKILIDNKISNNIKLNIANEYLTANTTKYKINIDNGRLYNDWLFNFE